MNNEINRNDPMLLEDDVSSNSFLKLVTKHYNVIIERKVTEVAGCQAALSGRWKTL